MQPIHLTPEEVLAEKRRKIAARRSSRKASPETLLARAGLGHLAPAPPRTRRWVHVSCLLSGSASPRKIVARYTTTCPRCHGTIVGGRDNVAAVWEAPIEA